MSEQEALKSAIETVGSAAELARRVGVKPQAVHQWRRVPAERVVAVEEATGGKVSRHELRPSLYRDSVPPKEEGKPQ